VLSLATIPIGYFIKHKRYLYLTCNLRKCISQERIMPKKQNQGESSVRLHLQCFYGKAGLHSNP
jgi:hypothetical protein